MRWLAIALMLGLAAPLPAAAQKLPARAQHAVDPALPAGGISFFPDSQRAPVSYQTVKGRVIFRAKIGNREVWALLDNGADRTLIDLKTAQAAGFKLDSRTTPVFGAGGGSLASQWVEDVPISIEGQFRARMPMLGLDMRAASKILGYPIELVLGADALMHMALRVDPFARTFHLTPTGKMDGIAASEAIALSGKRALVEIRIGGKAALVGIDLGSNGGLALSHAAWRRMGATGTHLGTGSATGATGMSYDVEVFEVPEMDIGRLTVSKVHASLENPRPGVGDGIIGMAILGQFVIVIDLGAGKLWLIAPPRIEATFD